MRLYKERAYSINGCFPVFKSLPPSLFLYLKPDEWNILYFSQANEKKVAFYLRLVIDYYFFFSFGGEKEREEEKWGERQRARRIEDPK